MEIKNARITNVSLGYEDHGVLTFGLTLEIAGGYGCVFGGYALDNYDRTLKKRVPCGKSMECLTEIMRVVGVHNWEDLNGKYIRIVDNGWGNTIDVIGNLMEDKWFNVKEFFNKESEE